MQLGQAPSGPGWGEMQAPMHLKLQAGLNQETFVGSTSTPNDLSMADISKQTMAMSAQLRQEQAAAGNRPSAEVLPKRVDTVLSRPTEAGLLGSDTWLPQSVSPSLPSSPPNPLAGCVDAIELERLMRQQMEQGSHMAQAAQVLQNMQSQMGPFPEEFLQQTMHEIAKRCADPAGLSSEWGAAAVAAVASGKVPPPPGGLGEQMNGWGHRDPATAASSPTNSLKPAEVSVPSEAGPAPAVNNRIEELNSYIRQQSQEYLEGQAEWSRQIAEVESECLRKLEKVRREKDEVERQARQEILRLRQKLRENGINDEGPPTSPGEDSPSNSAKIGAWAAGVSADEYNQVHSKWQSAEERIRQLEDYIKESAAKNVAGGGLGAADGEVEALKQVIVQSGIEVQQAKSEVQACKKQQEHKNQLWEHGARRILGATEQFLTEQGHGAESGHFASTATKVSLTLSSDKEGGNVGSLRRLLKDALSNGSDGKEKKERKASKRAKEEGAGKTPEVTGSQTTLSDSNASSPRSSRNSSPGPGIQVASSSGSNCSDSHPRQGAAFAFVSQLAGEMRQLLATGQQAVSPTAPSQAMPRSPSRSSKSPAGGAEKTKVQELLDGMAPARTSVAQHIIAVEKMLRFLEQDLRKECEAVLGKETMQLANTPEQDLEALQQLLASSAISEVQQLVPLGHQSQVQGMSALRCAQHRSSALLAQFVQLPSKLKAVFDLTKKLSAEMNGLVPLAVAHEAEARASEATQSKQQQTFRAELLQKQVQTLTSQVEQLGGPPDLPQVEGKQTDEEAAAVAREVQEQLQQGVSQEEQLLQARTKLRRMAQHISIQQARTKSLEDEVVEMQVSRHNERAQSLTMFQKAVSGFPKAPGAWPWSPSASTPDTAKQASQSRS